MADDNLMPPRLAGLGLTLGVIAGGAVLGGIYGAVVHPGPQYAIPVQTQVATSAAFGALATVAFLGTMALGVRMGAIPTV